jgi:hypothetical protein
MKIGESCRWFLTSLYVSLIIYILTSFAVGSFNPLYWGAAQFFLFFIAAVLILGAVGFLFED